MAQAAVVILRADGHSGSHLTFKPARDSAGFTLIPAASAMAAPVQWVASFGASVGGQGHDFVDDLLADRRHPRGPSTLPPRSVPARAPDAGLGLARPAHELDRAGAGGREQRDRGADVFLRGVAVADDRLQAAAIDGGERDADTEAHGMAQTRRNPARIHASLPRPHHAAF
jgi:hypothetical protein